MATRKVSAYNKHVKKFAKANPGLGKNMMKKAAAAWNKKTGKAKSKTNKSKSTTKTTKVRKTGKRKFTLPLAIIVPFLWKFVSIYQNLKAGNTEQAKKDALWHFACIDNSGKFNASALGTWTPLIIGMGLHLAASKLGVNRALGRAGVPLLRI